jgi:tetratricopeptide (TPR) repeat protein
VATITPRPPARPAPAAAGAPRLPAAYWPILALLAGATFAVFAGALRNGWLTFDDPQYVFNNLHVNRGLRLDSVLWFLTHSHSENWHPLTSWSHLLDVQLFGLSPAGHHAVSVLLHTLNAALLAVVLHRLTGAWWRSVLVAALFALHPLRVESVAWISERKDVLSGLFFLLTIEAYRSWSVRPDRARYAALLVALVLGLMSKPMLVTLPFVLVLLDVWPLGRLLGTPRNPSTRAPARPLLGLIAEKWPLFALSAASAVVTFLVQRGGGAVVSVEMITPSRRILNALVSYWRYIEKTLWPHDLAVLYPYGRDPEMLAAGVAAVALVAVTVLFLRQARRRPYLLVGWFWYLGMLVPVIGLVQVGSQAYADRYTYLPTIGLLIALVWFVSELVANSRVARAAAVGAFSLALVGFSGATVRQVPRWKDTRTVFEHALAVTRDNSTAHEKLGEVLLQEGQLQPAVEQLEMALRLRPGFAEAHTNLGSALGMLGRLDEAIVHFRAGLAVKPTADARHNLAFTLARMGRVDEAIPEYEAALRLDPGRYGTLVQLGTALAARGRLAEAATRLGEALQQNPADLETRRLLAVTALRQGQVVEAVAAYRELLRSSPDDLDALNNLAWILATHADPARRDGAEAVRLAERARSPEPVAVFYSTLGAAYAEAGRFPEAVSAGTRAVELARGEGRADEIRRYEEQLRSYRAGKSFHFAQ